jgi:aarF domain-containing kinase
LSRPTSTRPLKNVVLRRHASQFQPLAPPSPASLGKPTTAKTYRRSRKWLRRLIRFSLATGILYALDTNFYDSSFSRSFRTFATGLLIALDYKLNFRADPWIGDSVQDLHARSATRVFNLLRENGGLYLKIGQALAMQTAIMPPEFGKMFERMFDDATQNSWKDVER